MSHFLLFLNACESCFALPLSFSVNKKSLAPISLAHGGSTSHSSSSSVSSGGLYFAVGGGSTCGSEALNQSVSSQKSSQGAVACDALKSIPSEELATLALQKSSHSPGPTDGGGAVTGVDGVPLPEEPHPRYSYTSQNSNLDTLTQQPHTFIPQQQTAVAPETGSVFCFQVMLCVVCFSCVLFDFPCFCNVWLHPVAATTLRP